MRPPRRPSLLLVVACLAGCQLAAPTTGRPKGSESAKVAASPAATAVPLPGASGSPTAVASHAPAPLSSQGQVLGLDGKPAAGVIVRGYLVSDLGSGLVTENGAGIVANNGGNVIANNGGGYRLTDVAPPTVLVTTTDADGRFTLASPHGEPLNVEAAQSDTVKAISLNVAKTDGLTLKLAPTGTLAGRVTVPGNPALTDLSGVDVFIPGTGYIAKTDASGAYSIANVPVGSFTLDGRRTGLGKGQLAGVAVTSNQTTHAPDLALVPVVPAIAAITPPNGGPGAHVVITGDKFGASTGETFSVSFGGATVTQPERVDDHTVKVTVPDGATTGDVVLTLDGIPSAPKGFTVLKSLAVLTATHDFVPGEHHAFAVTATDTFDHPVPDPAVDWTASGAAIDVDASGAVSAKAAGAATLVAASGHVGASPVPIAVHADPVVVATVAGVPTKGDFDRPASPAPVYEGVGVGVEYRDPYQPAVGPDGNIYIADGGGWVSKTTPDGRVTKLAAVDGARAIAVATDGTCYVAAGNAIVKVAPDGSVTPFVGGKTAGAADGAGAAASFNQPLGLALAKDGTLYVYDSGNSVVRAVTSAGVVGTLAGVSAAPIKAGWYNAGPIAVGPDGGLWLGGVTTGIKHVDLADPAHPVVSVVTPAPFTPGPKDTQPGPAFGLVVDAKGNVFYTDPGAGAGYLREVDMSDPAHPTLKTLAGFGGYDGHLAADGAGSAAGFQHLLGIGLDPAHPGVMYVTETGYEHSQQLLRRVVLQ